MFLLLFFVGGCCCFFYKISLGVQLQCRSVRHFIFEVSHKSEMAGAFNRGDTILNKHFINLDLNPN